VSIPQVEAAERASAAFRSVFENGTKIELDHYVVYFAEQLSTLPIYRTYALASVKEISILLPG
jgi:hypothetical protein